MKKLIKKKQFVKDTVKYAKNNPKIINELRKITKMLVMGQLLPISKRDHKLTGNWKEHKECHIRPDVLLIYRDTGDTIELVRLGSHAELFR
jgi:mRNA interferase YafQ